MKITLPFALGLLLAAAPAARAQFTCTTNADSTLTIARYTGSGGALAIPSTIDGLPVTGIGDGAFAQITGLTSATIPSSVTSIGGGPFADCIFLSSITVDAGNAAYVSVAGVLFDKSEATLIQYPPHKAGTSYRIPNSVTTIGDDAFNASDYLTSVTLPNGLSSIGNGAFFLTALTNITIPSGVTNIGEYAFEDCAFLTSIYFEGNAPDCGDYSFETHNPNTTGYYLAGTSGWGWGSLNPPFYDVPTVMLSAIIFTANPTTGPVPLTVQFTSPSVDSAGNAITRRNWTFGDGSTSTAQNPSHTYTTAGTFSLTLIETNNSGVLIAGSTASITVSPIFTTLYSFTGGNDGAVPSAGLVISGNTLYGTMLIGGSSGNGSVFKVNTDGTGFANLYSFTNGSDGANPEAGLVLSGNTLYGTASAGGNSSHGTVFALNTDGTAFRTLYSFTGGNDGAEPSAGLVISGNTLYGTAFNGGIENAGTVFSVDTDGTGFSTLYSFTVRSDGGGAGPGAALIISGNTLYGTANEGGSEDVGTVFSLNTDGTGFTTLHVFSRGSDGATPTGGVVLSGNRLYGTASGNGSSGSGTVFAVNTDATDFAVLYSFTKGNDGGYPYGGLILSGKTLYGTADLGGGSGDGTVFAVNTDGTGFASLYSFTGGNDGANPYAGLTLSGKTLYGTAGLGGGSGYGTVFSLSLGPASPQEGSLQVTVSVSPSAGGTVSGGGTYAPGSSQTVTATANSGYTFANWTENANVVSSSASYTFTLSSNLNLVANFTANPETGSLQVTIIPASAITAGAQWQVDGGTLQNSGVTLSSLAVGDHTLGFSTLIGWTTPADQTVTITGGETTAATGVYTPLAAGLGSIEVSGRNVVLHGINGVSGTAYCVLTSTNLTVPLSQWTPVTTNVLTAGGNFAITATNTVIPTVPQSFYMLQQSTPAIPLIYENYTFTTLAGQCTGWFDGAGPAAQFNEPFGVAVDAIGNVYVADTANNTIRKVTASGVVTTLAGLATGPAGAADGSGQAARFHFPSGVAVDSSNNVYVADSSNHTIRKVTPAGVVTTLAGLAGVPGSVDGTGSSARFNDPQSVAVDSSGNVYVADSTNCAIRKITPAGVVTTLAGKPGVAGTNDAASGAAARFNQPYGVAVDSNGNVYVADTRNQAIRKISPGGAVTTLAGLGGIGGSTDGTSSAARFNYPCAVAVDASGKVYVADSANNTIRQVSPAGLVTTLVGSAGTKGWTNGTRSGALFYEPLGVAVDGNGNVYVADTYNSTIRKVTTPGGVVTTLAGAAAGPGSNDGAGSVAHFNYPCGVAVDGAGTLYVSDLANNAIRQITPAGVVTTLAGSASSGQGTNNGTGSAARFGNPAGLAVDSNRNVYVADYASHTIRKIAPGGIVTTLAGEPGVGGSANGTGSVARFQNPLGVAVDAEGNVYVADTSNNLIRKISPSGTVSTLAGVTGTAGAKDGPAATALFNYPQGVAVDVSGTVYVADTGNSTIRKITPGGVVSTLAGNPQITGASDGMGAAALFKSPFSLTLDSRGYLYVADSGNNTIRKVSPDGTVNTLAGVAGQQGGVDGNGAQALFNYPEGVAVDASGNLYVTSAASDTIRKGNPALPDMPVVDPASGAPGITRYFDVTNLTVTSWSWSIVRYPSASSAQLSSTTTRDPTLTPDVPDLFIVRFQGSDSLGRVTIANLSVAASTRPLAITKRPAPVSVTTGAGANCP